MIVGGWLVGCGLYSAKTATLRHFWERLRPLGEWWQKRDQKSRLFGAAHLLGALSHAPALSSYTCRAVRVVRYSALPQIQA